MTEIAETKVAIYARVSTEEQASEGYSLDAQTEMLRAYIESQDNWIIYDEYVDEGHSGRNTNRPQYRRMMNDIGKWDIMLVLKMDRIHRNSRKFMEMMDILKKKGKDFVSSTESLDTSTAMGRFVVDMIQRLAQLESEQIGERTKFGMREKAESTGGIMGSASPFGYRIEDGRLVTDKDEIETARYIFRWYLRGMTVDDICYRLNREGTLTRNSNAWNKFNMSAILHNPVYAGLMRWDDLLLAHDAEKAVSEEDFNKVQDIMRSRTKIEMKKGVLHLSTAAPRMSDQAG